jgi:Tfp pilus assembly protein PilZ
MSPHGRRDTRYSIRFPVHLSVGKRTLSLLTADVSHGGVFLCTDTPLPLMQLVGVHLVLPIGDRALKAHGMTVHVVKPDNGQGRVPGLGVQFYALDHTTRDSWEAFVRHVEAHCPPSPDQAPLRLPRGFTPEPVRRRFERHTAVLKVEPTTLPGLEEVYTRDVLAGRIFIPGALALPKGARVVVYVAHPATGQPFLLEGSVLGRTDEPPGLDVEFLHIDRRTKEEFLDFVRGGIFIDDEVVLDSKS